MTNGTLYFYRVTAVTATGEGGPSIETSATPTAYGLPVVQINCGGPGISGSPWAAGAGYTNGVNSWTSATGSTADTAGVVAGWVAENASQPKKRKTIARVDVVNIGSHLSSGASEGTAVAYDGTRSARGSCRGAGQRVKVGRCLRQPAADSDDAVRRPVASQSRFHALVTPLAVEWDCRARAPGADVFYDNTRSRNRELFVAAVH